MVNLYTVHFWHENLIGIFANFFHSFVKDCKSTFLVQKLSIENSFKTIFAKKLGFMYKAER